LALALLTGAGLAIHSFWNLTNVDLGVNTTHIQTFSLPVPDARPKDPKLITAYYQQMLSSIKSVPGVLDASVSVGLPLEGTGFGMPFTIAGQPEFADPSQRPGAGFGMVSPDYFKTLASAGSGPCVHRSGQCKQRARGRGERKICRQVLQRQRSAAAADHGRRVDSRRHETWTGCLMADCRRVSQCARGRISRRFSGDRNSVLADSLAEFAISACARRAIRQS
jgi:hypothetical protein